MNHCTSTTMAMLALAATLWGADSAIHTPPTNLPPATPALPFPPLDKLPIVEQVDPLVCLDGTPVKTKEDWEKKRQPELIRLLHHYMFGVTTPERLREGTPPAQVFEVDKETLAKEGVVWLPVNMPLAPDDPQAFVPIDLFMPVDGKGPFPTIVFMHAKGPKRKERPVDTDQIALITGRGYAVARIGWATGMSPTWKHYFSEHSGPWTPSVQGTNVAWRLPHSWAILAQMGWRVRRVVEALRTLPQVDPERIALMGGSRTGQPVLLAAAMDRRIKAVVCWQGLCEWRPIKGYVPAGKPSLEGWAPILREAIDKDRLGALPVGAWCLVAAIAPRPVLLCDTVNANPDIRQALELSLPVYRFLGADVDAPSGKLGIGLHGKGPLRLHLANKGHLFDTEDWKDWLRFLDEHLKPGKAEGK